MQNHTRSWLYWASIFVGMLIVFVAYTKIMSPGREGFAGTTAGDAAGTTTSGATTATTGATTNTTTSVSGTMVDGIYMENLASGFPRPETLNMYLTTFSQKTSSGKIATYNPATARWFHFLDDNKYASVMSQALPTNISSGMVLKNTKLIGPPSTAYGASGTYELRSFSASYFVNLAKDFDFAALTRPLILLRIFAETPNRVMFYLDKGETADTVTVGAIAGAISRTYTWQVPKVSITGNGQPTMYTLTYDAAQGGATRKLTLYVGQTENYSVTLSDNDSPILLGNSAMEVNPEQNLDLTLFAFAFFDAVLNADQVSQLYVYWNSHANGLAQTIAMNEAERLRVEAELAAKNRQLAALQSSSNVSCPSSNVVAPTVSQTRPFAWTIHTPSGAESISADDMNKCAPLKVPVPGKQGAGSSGEGGSSGSKKRFYVNYPSEVSAAGDAVVAVSPIVNPRTGGTAAAVASASGSNVDTSLASNGPTNVDTAFWGSLLTFVKDQQKLNDAAGTSNVSKSSATPASAYQELVNSVGTTDKTMPGPGATRLDLKAPVQDVKPAPAPTPVEDDNAFVAWFKKLFGLA